MKAKLNFTTLATDLSKTEAEKEKLHAQTNYDHVRMVGYQGFRDKTERFKITVSGKKKK